MVAQGDVAERVKLLEERRKASEAALWQLPAISLAAQAFLLAAGLNHDADNWARMVAGGLGLISAVATAGVLAYQGLRLSVLSRWVDQELDTELDEYELAKQLGGDHALKKHQKSWLGLSTQSEGENNRRRHAPNPFVWWSILLGCLLGADIYVLVRGMVGEF